MKQRLIRILVYEGDPKWITDVLKRRAVKGSHEILGRGIIKEAIVSDFLEEVISRELPTEIKNLEEQPDDQT